MSYPSFKEWLRAVENSPVGRAKIAFAVGTGPELTPASLNSRATISPGLLDLVRGKDSHFDQDSEDELDAKFGDKPKVDKGEYVKSPHKRKKGHKLGEDHRPHPQDHQIDLWIRGADDLEDALGRLRQIVDKHRQKQRPDHPAEPPDHEGPVKPGRFPKKPEDDKAKDEPDGEKPDGDGGKDVGLRKDDVPVKNGRPEDVKGQKNRFPPRKPEPPKRPFAPGRGKEEHF